VTLNLLVNKYGVALHTTELSVIAA